MKQKAPPMYTPKTCKRCLKSYWGTENQKFCKNCLKILNDERMGILNVLS